MTFANREREAETKNNVSILSGRVAKKNES